MTCLQHYEYVRLSALKYCQYHTGHLLAFGKTAIKILKQGVKFSNLSSVLQQLTFVLVVIFINLEHLSCPTLVLLFKLWKDKCRLEVRRERFVRNNTAMLMYTHICSSLINSKIVLRSRHTNFILKVIEIEKLFA